MKTKQCSKCGKIKPLTEFHKKKLSKDGYRHRCKKCRKKPIKPRFCEVCGEEFKPNSNSQKYCSKQCAKIIYNNKIKKYRQTHEKEIREYAKKYCKKWANQRRKSDINFRIASNLRTRIWWTIKNNNKAESTEKLLGCSIEELRKYIGNLFKKAMTWDNYATYWEIDHIMPCASFDLSKVEEQRKCFNYKNLQPLTITENRTKYNKIEPEEENKE